MTSPALQEIVALLGCPAAGHPAQYLFERAIEAAGLDWRFVTCDVAECDVDAAIVGVRALGFRGCLLSGPLRSGAMRHVTAPSPSAAFAAAVSLLERRPDGLGGHMTDGRGIVESLRAHIDPAGRTAVVVGAGACGRSTALELALAGAAGVLVTDPDPGAAMGLVEALAAVHAAEAECLPWSPGVEVPDHAAIVVLAPTAAPACLGGLRPDLVVADTTLSGRLTPAAQHAAAQGCCMVDGIEIHAVQTAIDFQTLSGIEPDVEMLREALEEFLS
ncbi:MAG: shikimate dehydrogenase family protein [Planctomycetaceae bacterium]